MLEDKRSALGVRNAELCRSQAVLTQDLLCEDARQLPERRRIARQQKSHFEWRAHDPLPHWHVGNHAIHDDRGGVAHSTCRTATATAALFAGEREEDRPTASFADEAGESVTGHTTTKVVAKLLLHVLWQTESRIVALPCSLQQRLEILGHQAVQESPLRTPRRTAPSLGLVGVPQHLGTRQFPLGVRFQRRSDMGNPMPIRDSAKMRRIAVH
jgi:hypothetical protein